MVKVAVMLAQGFEEIEALTVVDVLRRANITCDMVGFEEQVTGSHAIQVSVDLGGRRIIKKAMISLSFPHKKREFDSRFTDFYQRHLDKAFLFVNSLHLRLVAPPTHRQRQGLSRDLDWLSNDHLPLLFP